MCNRLKAMSLFANVGIAEAYLEEIGIDVILANEIDEKRAKFYNHVYPKTEMIIGDISKLEIREILIEKGKKENIDLIIATPPCQGMSLAGKLDPLDVRNGLIRFAVDVIKNVKPKYILLENVPRQLKTKIKHKEELMYIPEYLKRELGESYNFNKDIIINTKYYGVPQSRERAIFLLVRKDININWEFPPKEKIVTLEEAIGNLPSLDPYIYDLTEEENKRIFPHFEEKKEEGLKVSKWHYPPNHPWRQIEAMTHTPSGKTAFDNLIYFPKKNDGSIVKGYKNTYKRLDWKKPSSTITMYNRTISSQENVHPGRKLNQSDDEEKRQYSDPRVFTIYELLIIMSLPTNWNIPEWATDHFLRQVIGEGIPSLLIKKIMLNLIEIINKEEA